MANSVSEHIHDNTQDNTIGFTEIHKLVSVTILLHKSRSLDRVCVRDCSCYIITVCALFVIRFLIL